MTKEVRQNLSYAYRILGKLGLADHTYTHLSARPDGADYYYIYPFGLRFEEVTPECLLKVALSGEILEGKEYQYNSPYAKPLFVRKITSSFIDAIFAATNSLYLIAK